MFGHGKYGIMPGKKLFRKRSWRMRFGQGKPVFLLL